MNRKAVQAADMLVHYFKLCMKQSGAKWDTDNEAEIRQIIEDIFDGVDDILVDRLGSHLRNEHTD